MKERDLLLTACAVFVLAVAVSCGGGNDQCTPDCTGKTCGQDDGCGGKCAGCPAGQTCNQTTWQCESCTPDCTGKTCGQDDGCGGKCTGCPAGQTCNQTTWQCEVEGCQPRAGNWQYDDWQESTNDCNYPGIIGNGDGTYAVSNVTASSFQVEPRDNTQSFVCDMTGCDFSCVRADITQSFGGATIHIAVTVAGTMANSTNMSGNQSGTVTCEGQTCAAIAAQLQITFPCTVVIDWVGHWVN